MKTKTTTLKGLPAAVLAAAFLLPSVVGAQTTCRIYCPDGSSFVQECSSNIDPCIGSPGPGNPGGGYTPQLPPDPGPAQRRRYQAMLERRLVEPAQFAKYPISTDEQFAYTLSRLHTELSSRVVLANARRLYYEAQANAAWAKYRDYYQPRFALLDASDGLIPEIREGNLAARRSFEEADREMNRFEAVFRRFYSSDGAYMQAQRVLREEAFTAKLRVSAYLGGLTNSEVEVHVESLMPEVPEESFVPIPVQAAPWHFNDRYFPDPAYQQAIDRTQESFDRAKFRGYPVIGGNIDSRLALCETMAEEAAVAQKADRVAYSNWEDGSRKNAEAAKGWEVAKRANMRLWTETQDLRYGTLKAKSSLERTREVFKTYTWKCLLDSRRAVAWKTFRTVYLNPELKRLSLELFDGKQFNHSDLDIRSAWQLGTPLVAPSIKAYTRIKEIRSLKLLAKRLNGTIEENLLAAVDMLGSADSAISTELYGSVFSGADAEIRAEVRSVLGETDLPPAVQRSWHAYFVGGD